MSVKVRWGHEPKKPSVNGLEYNSNYQEFQHINARDRDRRKAIVNWLDKTHKSLYQLYYEQQALRLAELRNEAKEINLDEAIRIVNESIPENVGRGWFVNADSNYKPSLFSHIMDDKGLLNAGWNIAYDHYKWEMKSQGKTPLTFKSWLYTPQTMWRGHRGQKLINNDRFVAYSMRKSVAEKFAGSDGKGHIDEIKIRPIDTLGAYQTTGESEYFVPRWKLTKKFKLSRKNEDD